MQRTSSAKETGSLSRQVSFTVSQVSRGNSQISQPTSLHAFPGLRTEGTIEESIQILSVKSPHEEHAGYRRDPSRLSVRDKSTFELSNRVKRTGSNGTGFFRSFAGAGLFLFRLYCRFWLWNSFIWSISSVPFVLSEFYFQSLCVCVIQMYMIFVWALCSKL